jgi:hypothetical protein
MLRDHTLNYCLSFQLCSLCLSPSNSVSLSV